MFTHVTSSTPTPSIFAASCFGLGGTSSSPPNVWNCHQSFIFLLTRVSAGPAAALFRYVVPARSGNSALTASISFEMSLELNRADC